MSKLNALVKWFKEPRADLITLQKEANELLSAIESRLYAQETRAGYLNSMRTLKSGRELLRMLEGTSELNQIKFLKKLIKTLKALNKMKYC